MASQEDTLPAFEGDLATFPATELFGMASNLALTGTLELSRALGADERIQLRLRSGRLVGAQVSDGVGQIGQMLVRRYGLSTDDLDHALRVQHVWRQRGGYAPRLGVLLLGLGKLSTEVLEDALESTWVGAVRQALAWPGGQFAFWQADDGHPTPAARGVAVQRIAHLPEGEGLEWVPPRFSVDPELSLEESVLRSRHPEHPATSQAAPPGSRPPDTSGR
jgi:hypothetical protein